MRPLIEKELRENFRWLCIGFVVIGCWVWFCSPVTSKSYDFLESRLSSYVSMVAALFAAALGIVQSVFDLRTASRSYLWHRSVSAKQIYYSKIIAGAIIYSIATLVPLAFLAISFGSLGILNAPVRPIQVIPSCVICIACFAFHPAAMLMMARSGKWYGTKLFPILATTFVVLAHFILQMEKPQLSVGWIALAAVVVLAIFIQAAERMWSNLAFADDGTSQKRVDLFRGVVLSLGSIATIFLGLMLAMMVLSAFSPDASRDAPQYAIDQHGDVWYGWAKKKEADVREIAKGTKLRSGSQVQEGESPRPDSKLPEDIAPRVFQNLGFAQSMLDSSSAFTRFQWNHEYQTFDRRGYVLKYDFYSDGPDLKTVISRDGVDGSPDLKGTPFAGNPHFIPGGLHANENGVLQGWHEELFCDREGLYQMERDTGKLRTIVSLPIEHRAVTQFGQHGNLILLLQSAGKIHVYETQLSTIRDESQNDGIPRAVLWKTDVALLGVIPELPRTIDKCSLAVTEDNKLAAVFNMPQLTVATIDVENAKTWKQIQIQPPIARDPYSKFIQRYMETLTSFAIPPIVYLTGIGTNISSDDLYVRSWSDVLYHLQQHQTLVVVAIISLILAILATYFACQHRELTRAQTAAWCVFAVMLGWAAPLAVLAIYRRAPREACNRCGVSRHIDEVLCPKCNAHWEPAEAEGIEIYDDERTGERRTLSEPIVAN